MFLLFNHFFNGKNIHFKKLKKKTEGRICKWSKFCIWSTKDQRKPTYFLKTGLKIKMKYLLFNGHRNVQKWRFSTSVMMVMNLKLRIFIMLSLINTRLYFLILALLHRLWFDFISFLTQWWFTPTSLRSVTNPKIMFETVHKPLWVCYFLLFITDALNFNSWSLMMSVFYICMLCNIYAVIHKSGISYIEPLKISTHLL